MSETTLVQPSDKRKYIRHPAEIPIVYHLSGEQRSRTDQTRNISLGGLCFQTISPIRTGTIITLKFPTINSSIELKGTVVWCSRENNRVEVGVEFRDENEAYRARTIEEICHSQKHKFAQIRNSEEEFGVK